MARSLVTSAHANTAILNRRVSAVWAHPATLAGAAAPAMAASTPSATPEGRFHVSCFSGDGGLPALVFGLPTTSRVEASSGTFWRLTPTDAVGAPGDHGNPFPTDARYTVWLPRSHGIPTVFLADTRARCAWSTPEHIAARDTRTHLAFLTCAEAQHPMQWDTVNHRWWLAPASTGMWLAEYPDGVRADPLDPAVIIERTIEWKGLSYTDVGAAAPGCGPHSPALV